MGLDLKTGIGISKLNSAKDAGVEAASKAIKKLGAEPDAVIVFGAPKYNQKQLLKGITSVTKDTPLIGGTTSGEISPSGLSVNSVIVLALESGKDVTFTIGIGKDITKGEKRAGAQLAKSVLREKPKDPKTLLMFPDGLAGDGLKIVEGAQKVLGKSFEIVGGALADEDKFSKTFQYYNGEVLQGAVVGMLISGRKAKTATGVRSGWESIGARFLCTKAKGNIVQSFDGRPALDVYKECLGPERAEKLPAIGLKYPMGLVDERAKIEGLDYFQIRCPLAIDEKKKEVTFAAAIPKGKEVTLTCSSRATIVNGSKQSATQAKKYLGKRDPSLVMVFSCVARKMVLGRRTNDEIRAVQNVFGKSVPIFGFYTYGEIGPIDKRKKSLEETRWHNETLVIWALG